MLAKLFDQYGQWVKDVHMPDEQRTWRVEFWDDDLNSAPREFLSTLHVYECQPYTLWPDDKVRHDIFCEVPWSREGWSVLSLLANRTRARMAQGLDAAVS